MLPFMKTTKLKKSIDGRIESYFGTGSQIEIIAKIGLDVDLSRRFLHHTIESMQGASILITQK